MGLALCVDLSSPVLYIPPPEGQKATGHLLSGVNNGCNMLCVRPIRFLGHSVVRRKSVWPYIGKHYVVKLIMGVFGCLEEL